MTKYVITLIVVVYTLKSKGEICMSKPKEIVKLPSKDRDIRKTLKKRQQSYCDRYYDTWSDTCFKCPLHSLTSVTGHDCVKAYALYILK